MTTATVSLCNSCAHLERPNVLEALAQSAPWNVARCAAFPDGIPEDILSGADHRTPDPRQNNKVVHNLVPSKERELQAWFEVARMIGAI